MLPHTTAPASESLHPLHLTSYSTASTKSCSLLLVPFTAAAARHHGFYMNSMAMLQWSYRRPPLPQAGAASRSLTIFYSAITAHTYVCTIAYCHGSD